MTGQETSWLWGTGLIAFAFGLMCGVGFAMFFIHGFGRSKKLQAEVDRLEKELEEYRGEVTDHFKETSRLVKKMTESYRDVYHHLAASSQKLCQEPIDTLQLGHTGSDPAKLIEETGGDTESPQQAADLSSHRDSDLEEGSLGDTPYVPQQETQAVHRS